MKTDELATGLISMQSKVVHEASLCVVAVTREVSVSTHTTASRIVRHVRHGFLGGGSSNVLQDTVDLSTTEEEYMAKAEVVKEGI